jgi:hypothetical protein
MHEEVWRILMLIYFYMHLTWSAKLGFIISKVIHFIASKPCMSVQCFSMDVVMLEKPSFKFLVNCCWLKALKAFYRLMLD